MKRYLLFFLLLLLIGCGKTPEPEDIAVENEISPILIQESIRKASLEETLSAKSLTLYAQGEAVSCSLYKLGYREDFYGDAALDMDSFYAFCEELNKTYGKDAVNASVARTDSAATPFAFFSDEPGECVDVLAFSELLANSDAGQTLIVPFTEVSAEITEASLREKFSLLSEFTTSFSGSTLGKANRVKNITLAASRINGVILAPGEGFSMNRCILDRTEANGYYLAAAIRNGTYTKEYGGSVCQVSSTLFNAVMMADLTITERYHHSWPMTYVPIGRDATIATGYKDFCFTNSSDSDVVIVAWADASAKTVTVQLYGKHSKDFSYIEIISKRTGTLDAKGTQKILDESLPAGTTAVERKSRQGKTSVTYKDYYDKAGNRIKRVVAYEDKYPSIEGIELVSPDLYY